MTISELDATLHLVVKFTNFATQLHDGWYIGSAEVDAFRNKVWILSAKRAQFANQLRRYGISEDDHLLRLLKAANESLEKEQQYVLKLQKSRVLRWKKKIFPVELSYILGKVLEVVEAGPQLLAARVANHDLLQKNMVQTPASLPFGPDSNHVPIVASILKVRSALENLDGPRVVTLYAGPGMGKSSLVKYVALYYQAQKQQAMNTSSPQLTHFLDGVQYLFCGQQAQDRVKQLQLELLQSLGFRTRYALANDGTAADGVQEGEYPALPSLTMKLRSCLAEQNLLIVLDGLWEEKVLQEFLVPAQGVKYLVTSQRRDIWGSAEQIQLEGPNQREARQIMANHTDGLPIKGEFPENLQSVADAISRAVEYHPLSLANVGISINKSWATDVSQWELIRKTVKVHLDQNGFRSPVGYDTPYNLALSASMMLMVESLHPQSQRILCLLALFEGTNLPQYLVKFFFKLIQPKDFALKFANQQKFLEDRSLIELRIRGNKVILGTHGLRTYYIRKQKAVEVMCIASQILTMSGDPERAEIIKKGEAEETLVAVLSAIYFDQSFKALVANTLEKHLKIINGKGSPRSLTIREDALHLAESARDKEYETRPLVRLLNADHGEQAWKHQAHEYAKKIIIKFICQGKLDDHSMARLLQLPQTTSTACDALSRLLSDCHARDYHDHNITFSGSNRETMNVLVALLRSDEASREQRATERRTAAVGALLHVIDYENKDTIFTLATKCNSAADSFARVGEGVLLKADLRGPLEQRMELMLFGKDHEVRLSAGNSILNFSKNKGMAKRIANFPNALRILFNLFTSEEMFSDNDRLQAIAGAILSHLSIAPENRIKFGAVEGIWEGFGGILVKLELAWRATGEEQNRRKLEKRACTAAGILGYLALEEHFRKALLAAVPDLGDGLLFLQLIEMATGDMDWFGTFWFNYSTRAVTVLYSNVDADPRFTELPRLEDVFEVFPFSEGRPLLTTMSLSLAAIFYIGVRWTRVVAYLQMGFYSEALTSLDEVHLHLQQIPKPDSLADFGSPFCQIGRLGRKYSRMVWRNSVNPFRDCRIFLLAILEDYAGALLGANMRIEEDSKCFWPGFTVINLAERGVLKRLSGDLQGALDDLNSAATQATTMITDYDFIKHEIRKDDVLWHRGYVKYLLGDNTGARADADSAQQLKVEYFEVDDTIYHQRSYLWMLAKLPVTYLGFSS